MMYILGLLTALPLVLICAWMAVTLNRSRGRSNEPELTPADLRALQESAEELIKSITETVDESMEKFERSRASLEDTIVRAQKAAEFFKANAESENIQVDDGNVDRIIQVAKLSESGLDTTEIARTLSIGSGEVELLLNLCPKLEKAS